MANLLANQMVWVDQDWWGAQPPPRFWDGEAYVVDAPDFATEHFALYLVDGFTPVDGDTLSGSVLGSYAGPGTLSLAYGLIGSLEIREAVQIQPGGTAFTFTAIPYGVLYVVSSEASQTQPSSLYGLNITVTAGDTPPPLPDVSYNCDCDDEYPRRSRGQLRSELMARLGFADPIADVSRRTLGALRADLMARLGYAAQVGNPPPGMSELLTSLISESEQVLWRRLELDRGGNPLPPRLEGPDDLTTLDATLVFSLALSSAKAHYGKADARLYGDMAERQLADYARRSPPGVVALLNSFLADAQEQLFRRYDVLRTERFFSWPLEAGVRMYDIPGNEEGCEKRLDPRKLSWVGIEYDGVWTELQCGIAPESYSHDQRGRPQRYEVRQCIELHPIPDETRGRLMVKGRFDLLPFDDDEAQTTIDYRLVFLMALANAKAHFAQPDANNYVAQLETMMQNLVAGSHHTRRYVPGSGRRTASPYAQPRPTEPFR